MAEKPIYAHGELDAVKKRLGPMSEAEAKKMQSLLGGTVGRERSEYEQTKSRAAPKADAPRVKKPSRIIETADAGDGAGGSESGAGGRKPPLEKPSYAERVKMDMLCGDTEYGIKSWFQVLVSRLSFFKDPPDKVSSYFVRRILNDYCGHIEYLITQTRFLFPRNNQALGERLKRASLFAYVTLDTIRRWNLDAINAEKTRLQRRAGNVYVADFAPLLYEIYRPIYKLDALEITPHIEFAYNTLFRLLFLENATAETGKKQELVGKTIAACRFACKDARRLLYPLLLKLTSSVFYYHDDFFTERGDSIEAFLGLDGHDRIVPPQNLRDGSLAPAEDEEAAPEDAAAEGGKAGAERLGEAEQKAFSKGLAVLDQLFPGANMSGLEALPDLYPYFADVKTPVKGSELIAPEDPALTVLILAGIVEELLYGFRKIKFARAGGVFEQGDEIPLESVLDNWHALVGEAFERQYIPRIQECVRLFQHGGAQKKNTPYATKLRSAVSWTKRMYFFPYYDYKDNAPPPFKRNEITPFFPFVRHFRRQLSVLAAAIDKAQKSGGRDAGAPVEGIANPWDPYVFQIENPLSKRLDMLLAKSQRDNISLIFFTLAIVTVLDDLMNEPGSAVYRADFTKLFRTAEDGESPVLWVGKASDTFERFKNSLPKK